MYYFPALKVALKVNSVIFFAFEVARVFFSCTQVTCMYTGHLCIFPRVFEPRQHLMFVCVWARVCVCACVHSCLFLVMCA